MAERDRASGEPRGHSRGRCAEIGVGMLGYAFMGKAHSNAYRTLPYMTWPPPLMPRLVTIAGRNEDAVAEAARALRVRAATPPTGARSSRTTAIELFDNCGPNAVHAEPSIAAAEAGKHVLCEKPLGRDAAESYEIWQRVAATGVKHMCAFNYRFVPAVRLAREMIEAGELGEITHFRGAYLQDWGATDAEIWRFDKDAAGSGALGDLGAHVIDLARYLVGEIATVVGARRATFQPRPRRSTTPFEAVVELRERRGRDDRGHALRHRAQERVPLGDQRLQGLDRVRPRAPQRAAGDFSDSAPGASAQGFRTVLVSEADHPFWEYWWPPGTSSAGSTPSSTRSTTCSTRSPRTDRWAPHGATFEDGYRAAEVCDAILESAASGQRQELSYRDA